MIIEGVFGVHRSKRFVHLLDTLLKKETDQSDRIKSVANWSQREKGREFEVGGFDEELWKVLRLVR
jgi:hypothetical protein